MVPLSSRMKLVSDGKGISHPGAGDRLTHQMLSIHNIIKCWKDALFLLEFPKLIWLNISLSRYIWSFSHEGGGRFSLRAEGRKAVEGEWFSTVRVSIFPKAPQGMVGETQPDKEPGSPRESCWNQKSHLYTSSPKNMQHLWDFKEHPVFPFF